MPGPLELRQLVRPLALISLSFLVLMLVWSVAVPTFRGADENVHHDFVRYLTETWDYPDYDELRVSRRTLSIGSPATGSPAEPRLAPPVGAEQAIEDRSERPSWRERGPAVRDGPPNQLAQHPPLYYVPTAAVVRLVDSDGDAPVDRVIWQLRVLNVLTLLPLPVVAADIARRFTSSGPVVLAAAAAVVAVPQLAHEGATVSNDPLQILLGSLTMAGVARLITGDRRWGTATATGLAAGAALLTKGFAVPLVPAVGLACLLPLWPGYRAAADGSECDSDHTGTEPPGTGDRVETGGILARTALVTVLALVVGGWWWIRNIVVHGNPQPGVRLRERVEGVDVDLLEFAGSFTGRLVSSFWGNIGWRETQLPPVLTGLLTVVLVLAVAAGCWRRWPRLVLVVPTIVAGAMVLAAGWGAYRKTGVSHATQGRYLFAGIAALAALAAIGLARMSGRLLPRLPVLVFGAGAVLQLATLALAVRRYWAGGGIDRLRALVAFSPLPDAVTVALLALAPLCVMATLVSLWRAGDPVAGDPTPSPDLQPAALRR
jgi:small subunit ribosomal protein S36